MPRTGAHLPHNGRPKGSKNKRTVLKIETIEAMRQPALTALNYFLEHKDEAMKFEAVKTVLKYILPTPQQSQKIEGGLRVEVVYVNRRVDGSDDKT